MFCLINLVEKIIMSFITLKQYFVLRKNIFMKLGKNIQLINHILSTKLTIFFQQVNFIK